MKRKIVMLYPMSFRPYQGRYLRAYNQAQALLAAGHDVQVVCWDRECQSPETEDVNGIQVKRFAIKAGVGQGPRKNGINVARFNSKVLNYLLRHDYDVVHCCNLDAMVTGLTAARLRRKKAVLDLCEPEYYGFWDRKYAWILNVIGRMEKGLARRFDHVFVHNLYQVEKFRAAGVNRLTQVGSYPNRTMLRDAIPERHREEVVIGRLGTIYEDNGMEELVAGFHRLLERAAKSGSGVKYKLFLAGRVYDSYRPTLEALLEPLAGYVEQSGAYQATDLPRLYDAIDISTMIYCRNSWFKNVTPTKLFDSMINGVPVLANAIGEVPQIVNEGPCGLIVDESDPDSICDGIERLAGNPELHRQMAERSLQLAREKYTWEAYQDQFLAAYNAL
jgi:glycosyltransferase involved in cell wall biosynthesis